MRAGALCCIVLAAAVLAGCGSGSSSNGEAKKTAAQIVADARAAALAADDVHIAGTINDGGTPLTLDLEITKGHGGKGAISENGLSFQIVRIGSKAYLKGSDAFLKKFAGAGAPLLSSKWLVGPANTGQLASLVPITDLAQLLKGALLAPGVLSKRGETTFIGQKVVAIANATTGGTLYVAATGKPLPVAVVSRKDMGTVTFTDWDKSVTIAAPKGAVDISKLGSS